VPIINLTSNVDPLVLGSEDGEPRLYEIAPRVVTTAHPFSEDDLRAFIDAGEHTGLE
jgi:hypothetical protein